MTPDELRRDLLQRRAHLFRHDSSLRGLLRHWKHLNELRSYARLALHDVTLHNCAFELQVFVERQLGAMLPVAFPRGGDRRTAQSRSRQSLSDFRITPRLAARFRILGSVSGPLIRVYITQAAHANRFASHRQLLMHVQT